MSRSPAYKKRRAARRKKFEESVEVVAEPRGTPEDRGLSGLNNDGTGRTRDLTMWERDEKDRLALERLRRLNQGEW